MVSHCKPQPLLPIPLPGCQSKPSAVLGHPQAFIEKSNTFSCRNRGSPDEPKNVSGGAPTHTTLVLVLDLESLCSISNPMSFSLLALHRSRDRSWALWVSATSHLKNLLKSVEIKSSKIKVIGNLFGG